YENVAALCLLNVTPRLIKRECASVTHGVERRRHVIGVPVLWLIGVCCPMVTAAIRPGIIAVYLLIFGMELRTARIHAVIVEWIPLVLPTRELSQFVGVRRLIVRGEDGTVVQAQGNWKSITRAIRSACLVYAHHCEAANACERPKVIWDQAQKRMAIVVCIGCYDSGANRHCIERASHLFFDARLTGQPF